MKPLLQNLVPPPRRWSEGGAGAGPEGDFDPPAPGIGAACTYAVRTTLAHDADEHAGNLSRWEQLYDQLSPGLFTGTLTELWLDDAQVFRETTSHTVRQSCLVWPASFWFGIPHCEGECGTIGAKGIGNDAIALRPGGCEFELLTPNAFDILGVVVDAAALTGYAFEVEHMDLRAVLREHEVLRVGAAARRQFSAFVVQALSEVGGNASVQAHGAARRNLRQAMLCSLVMLLGAGGGEPRVTAVRVNRQRLVSRVRDFVLAHPEETIGVPDLCQRFHVSRRTLQNCFHHVLNVSPAAYLRTIRLNAVRRELKNPVSRYRTVQDVAAAWGFWHLSQFGSDYKRLFGELPSQSLRSRTTAAG